MIDVCLILGSILRTDWISRLELSIALKIAEADLKASGESPCHKIPIQVVYPPTILERATASSPAPSRPPNVEYLLAAETDSTWDERFIVSISSFNRDGLTDQRGQDSEETLPRYSAY